MRFQGKICVVTGAGRGIGAATARAFAGDATPTMTGAAIAIDGGLAAKGG